ncbi:hypothetical protein [Aminicella lysinilytica]|uniref:hypothetical protein n=1 Tax=Aminicella lysinilytica TaxID=433323 RepID=UPI0026ED82C4|nr:hypothetical protein [Aminicella lysinilytica]
MKIKSYALHQIDINDYASTEHWYYTYHGPQLARRYGPWMDRFESYRPVPAPPEADAYGLVNYFCTVGIWNGVPETGPKGELSLTTPEVHARPFHFIGPAQCTEDFKGGDMEPEQKSVLRWVQLFRYPDGVDKDAADKWYTEEFASQACNLDSMYRFFSFKALQEDIRLPGEWTQTSMAKMKGQPEDHCWDRLSEMWFDDFNDWKDFIGHKFTGPAWATNDTYPFVKCGEDFRSCFLLERPAYDWLKSEHCYL